MHTVKDEWQYVDYDNLQSLVRYMANLVVGLSKSNVRLSKAGVKEATIVLTKNVIDENYG